MAHPTRSAPQVAIPLPSDAAVRRVIGKSYDPERTLNVIKMFAGTEEMFDATIGLVKAIFDAQGVDPKTREMIILRAAIVLDSPYERQATVRWSASTPNTFSSARRPTNCPPAAPCAMRLYANFSTNMARRSPAR